METKNMNIEQTKSAISILEKRVEFNNRLNEYVRKFVKERHLVFNPYQDSTTQEMRDVYKEILLEEKWMPMDVKKLYASSCAEVFGQVYSPAVNRYLLDEMKRLKAHLYELENAMNNKREDLSWATVTRDLSENRMNLEFDGVPSDNIRKVLKANGFRWSPYRKVWTRQLTREAERSLNKMKAELGGK